MTTETVINGPPILNRRGSQANLGPLDYLIILVCLILIPSAVVHGLLDVNGKFVFAVLVPFTLFLSLISNRLKGHKTSVFMIIILLITGAAGSFVSGVFSQLLMGITLAISLLAGHQLMLILQKTKALRIVSIFTLVLLVGGIIGILYSLGGNRPILDVQVGYRTTYLYLTTFSFAIIDSYIRPSGIFDEPGTFAMYAAIITMFNDTMNQNRRLNISILVLMVFTGSLAGLFMILLYLLASNSVKIDRKKTLIGVTVLIALYSFVSFMYPNHQIIKAIDVFYSDRLEVVDGRLTGDNRSSQLEEFFSLVDENILTYGAKTLPKVYEYYDQSSHPFSIVFGYGLIISLPYFVLLLWLLIETFKNRFYNSYTSLGLFFLLLQRPYLYNMLWSIMITAVVWLIYTISRDRSYLKIVA